MKDIINSIKIVFTKSFYIFLAALTALTLLAINAIVIKRGFIVFVLQSEGFDWLVRIKLIGRTLLNIGASLTVVDKIFLMGISLLAGISISLLVYYTAKHLRLNLESGMSLTGVILSFIGVGCASCGSVFLSSIIGFSATAAFIGFLPLNGKEIGLVSLALLLWSIYIVSKKIQKPLVCEIPQRKQEDN